MMKSRFSFLFVIAAALSACAPNALEPVSGEYLRGEIASDLAVTKSILLDNPGVSMENHWTAGDRIGVFGGGAENTAFTVAAGDLSSDRKVADFHTEGKMPSGKLQAYSPYQDGAARDGNNIVLQFPDKQKYVDGNGAAMPDPAANLLVGEGTRNAGISFRSVIAVLKIGQVFDKTTLVKSVEFRDLSGAAVAGDMKLTFGSEPSATITGSGQVITLDMGDGVEFEENVMKPLFLIVPARQYAKGFEITFVAADGSKTVKTVAKEMGKTLSRGVVYLIGDITGTEYVVKEGVTLQAGATLMTPEVLDKIRLLKVSKADVYDAEGNLLRTEGGQTLQLPELTLRVHKDLQPAVGKWLVFDQPTEDLPEGGIFRISACKALNDTYYEVVAGTEADFAAPYKELSIGGEMYDAEGNVIEGAGLELDLASHLKSIRDAEGNLIQYSFDPSGQILLAGQDPAELPVWDDEVATKGKWTGTFSAPKLFFKNSQKHAEVTFGAQLSLNTKISFCVADGELQYLHFNVNPVFKLSADFVLKGETTAEWPFHLITLEFTPIMVAPGLLITPSLVLKGEIGLGGTIQFSSSVSYTYDMGTFGMSYNIGTGFIGRRKVADPSAMEVKPEVGDVTGSLYAHGKLIAAPYLSVYGLLGLGLEAGFNLKFGIEGSTEKPPRLFLTPELELVPSVAVLGGRFTHRFSDFSFNVEFKPLWERYLAPVVELREPLVPTGPVKKVQSYYYTVGGEPRVRYSQFGTFEMLTRADGISYDLASTVKTLDPWKVAIEVTEVEIDKSVPWKFLLLEPNNGDPEAVRQPWTYWEIPSEKRLSHTRVGLYDIMEIPAGQFNEVTKSGVGAEGAFPSGKTYLYDLVFVNKSTGAELKSSDRNHFVYQRYRRWKMDWNAVESKGRYYGSPVFAMYWPTSPEGNYWITLSQDQMYSVDWKKFPALPHSYEEEIGSKYFTGVSWDQN